MSVTPAPSLLFSQLMSEQGYVPLFSRVLGAPIVIARDASIDVPHGMPVYTLAECDRLLSGRLDADGLRDVHRIKTLFSGAIETMTFEHQVESPGPSLMDLFPAPVAPLPADLFSSCFLGLSAPPATDTPTAPLPAPASDQMELF